MLIRHGVTEWNLADRFQGTTDTLLHQTGKDQALANGKAIEALIRTGRLNGDNLTILSSPLTRAQQSAKIIADHLTYPHSHITTVPALREISLGRWQGMNNLKVKETFYEERQSRKLDRWHFKPKGGESLSERAKGVSETLMAAKPDTVVIAHAGILRIALHVLGKMEQQAAAGAAIPHEGLLYFDGHQLQNFSPAN